MCLKNWPTLEEEGAWGGERASRAWVGGTEVVGARSKWAMHRDERGERREVRGERREVRGGDAVVTFYFRWEVYEGLYEGVYEEVLQEGRFIG